MGTFRDHGRSQTRKPDRPPAGEANCRARHQRNILAGSAFVAYSLLRLGLQVCVYSYSAACDHHPLFPRLIAPLLHDDLMVTCRHTHNRCRVAHEISIYFDFRIRGRGRQVQFCSRNQSRSALALISPSVQRSASVLMDMTITVTALGAVL